MRETNRPRGALVDIILATMLNLQQVTHDENEREDAQHQKGSGEFVECLEERSWCKADEDAGASMAELFQAQFRTNQPRAKGQLR